MKMDNSVVKRKDFANRLRVAGCSIIDLELSTDWADCWQFCSIRILDSAIVNSVVSERVLCDTNSAILVLRDIGAVLDR